VTVAHPGGVATAIAQSARRALTVTLEEERTQKARFQRLLKLPPERAGEIIFEAIAHRRDRV
jgi:hypothetical protein